MTLHFKQWPLKLLGLTLFGVFNTPAVLAETQLPEGSVTAQNSALSSHQNTQGVSFGEYLLAVEQYNLELSVELENIATAQAEISMAGRRPDPSLNLELGPKEYSRAFSPKPRVAKAIGLEWTLETGGKRAKRIQAARSGVQLAKVVAEGTKHSVYQQSADAFAEACRSRRVLTRMEQSLLALSDMVRINEVRRQSGDIAGLELLQSRSERDQFKAEVVKARAEAQAAWHQLSLPLGKHFDGIFGLRPLHCELTAFDAKDDIPALIQQALETRDAMKIARAELESARNKVALAVAERSIDPTFGFTYTHTPTGRSTLDAFGESDAGDPRSRSLGITLSIPIPFFNLQRGELIQAESEVTKALLMLRQAELTTQAEVHISYRLFIAARENVAHYQSSVLLDSNQVLEGIRLSYQQGAASLLEVLSAQQSADDAHQAYLQAVADLTTSVVRLQLSLGQVPAL